MRMTAQRKQILDILKQANHPLSAEMIMNKLPEDTLNLSTIYRSLDLFFAQEIVSKSYMNHTTYYYLNQREHHHYMICINCQKMYEIDCHIHHIADDIADKHGFKITHHDMTVYGYCKACQASLNL
ncbi:MAG: Fur family transcriptional regulator [Acholeplasmataceae bacterium]|jgi:Fur family ferric uptake transcriptional regulator